MTLAVRFNARPGDENHSPSRQRRLNKAVELRELIQPSLARLEDDPRCHRALKRTAKIRPSLRDEEVAHLAQKLG
jgi:hypothetical protein